MVDSEKTCTLTGYPTCSIFPPSVCTGNIIFSTICISCQNTVCNWHSLLYIFQYDTSYTIYHACIGVNALFTLNCNGKDYEVRARDHLGIHGKEIAKLEQIHDPLTKPYR